LQNAAFGYHALASNSAGSQNSALGWNALSVNGTGSYTRA